MTPKKTLAIRSKDNKHNAGSVSTGGKIAPTAKSNAPATKSNAPATKSEAPAVAWKAPPHRSTLPTGPKKPPTHFLNPKEEYKSAPVVEFSSWDNNSYDIGEPIHHSSSSQTGQGSSSAGLGF